MSKIILIGEHSVLYGNKAVAMPLKNKKIHISVKKNSNIYYNKDKNFMNLVHTVFKKIGKKPRVKFKILSELPINKGLGSSAKFAIEIIKSIYSYYNKRVDDDTIYNIAKEYEDKIHNPSSGIDIKATLSSKPIIFQKDRKIVPIDFNLNSKIYIFDTHEKSKTKKAVKLIKDNEEINKKYIDEIASLTDQFISHRDDLDKIGNIFNRTNDLLFKMNLGTEKSKKIIELFKPYVKGIKISGSGLGGIVIALVSEEQENEVKNILKNNQIKLIGIEKI